MVRSTSSYLYFEVFLRVLLLGLTRSLMNEMTIKSTNDNNCFFMTIGFTNKTIYICAKFIHIFLVCKEKSKIISRYISDLLTLHCKTCQAITGSISEPPRSYALSVGMPDRQE